MHLPKVLSCVRFLSATLLHLLKILQLLAVTVPELYYRQLKKYFALCRKARIDTIKVETDVRIHNEEDVIGMETDGVCVPQECEPEALERHKITLVCDDSVLAVLADGYNVRFVARSIKDGVKRQFVNRLAAAHIHGIIGNGSTVRLSGLPTTGTRSGAAIRLRVKLK